MHCLAVRLKPHAAAPLLRVSGAALSPEALEFSDLARRLAPLRRLVELDSLERAYRCVIAALRALAREASAFDDGGEEHRFRDRGEPREGELLWRQPLGEHRLERADLRSAND